MDEKMASKSDILDTILLLNLMKFRGYSFSTIARDIRISVNTLYYLRSTGCAGDRTCFYIQEKIKEVYPEDYKFIMEKYGKNFIRRNENNAILYN